MTTPPAIRISVNDRMLPAVGVLEQGRVLVPLRALVDALHLDLRTIRLPLPPPARIIAGRWYAPVRAMARLVHAQIQYDARARLAAVYTPVVASATPKPVAVRGEQPAAGARVGSAYPTIAASLQLPGGATIAGLRMSVDGIDVSADASYAGTYVTYIPRAGLAVGRHRVVIAGFTSSGTPFDTSWSFQTTRPPAADVSGLGGLQYQLPYVQFYVPGVQFIGGSSVPVQATAPPGGSAFAFVCTSPWQYELFSAPTSDFYYGSVPTPRVNYPIYCPVTVMYIASNGDVSYAAAPQTIQLLPIATPQPAPTPTPNPTPIYTRYPLPTPVATRTPLPHVVHTPIPLRPPGKPIVAPTQAPIAPPVHRPIYRRIPIRVHKPPAPAHTAAPVRKPVPLRVVRTPKPKPSPS